MRALSIRQPWATLIVAGIPIIKSVTGVGKSTTAEETGKVLVKDIENRTWPLPNAFELPQRIMVHVSKRDDDFETSFQWLCNLLGGAFGLILLHYSKRIPRGAIIGEVDIVDCVTESASPWFVGPYGFVLRNPSQYVEPIPCRGKPSFFEPELRRHDVLEEA